MIADTVASQVGLNILLDYKAESMSGPIVRTGTTPEFWKNWDRAFGGKKKATDGTKKVDKSAKADAANKVVKKAAKKASKKSK